MGPAFFMAVSSIINILMLHKNAPIGTASANSAKFRGIRLRIYYDNAGDNMTLTLFFFFFFFFIWFFTSTQQSFSYAGRVFLGWTSTKLG